MTTETRNAGRFQLGGDTQGGQLSLNLGEDLGHVFSRSTPGPILGLDVGSVYNHSFDHDTDYFIALPFRAYIDFVFADNVSAGDNRNVFKIFGGASKVASDYGSSFPFLGGGGELYLGTEQSEDKIAFFCRFQGQAGALGALSAGSEGTDPYQTLYDGVTVISGLARLGLNFYRRVNVAAEALIGTFEKPDDYWNSNWSDNNIEGPDAYNDFYGVSLQFRLGIKRFSMGLAYYYLNRTAGGYFDAADELGFGDVNDSTENSSHRVAGNISYRLLDRENLKLDLGGRFNYYTSDKNTNVTINPPDEPDFSSASNWNNESLSFSVSLSLALDWFSIEAGGGYRKGDRAYALGCGPYCEFPEGQFPDAGWNLFLITQATWGGS